MWCRNSGLRLMVSKTKEAVFQKGPSQQPQLTTNGATIERMSSAQCPGGELSVPCIVTLISSFVHKDVRMRNSLSYLKSSLTFSSCCPEAATSTQLRMVNSLREWKLRTNLTCIRKIYFPDSMKNS